LNTQLPKPGVHTLTIDERHAGQRIDNFLFTYLKGVPKSRIYRSLRQGEVRVNKKRCKPDYRVQLDDQVRIPPVRVAETKELGKPGSNLMKAIEDNILYEDEGLIVLNKPVGIASHGGSGINFGAIEIIRHLRPKARFLELVHRLDRETSGCLMVAKKRAILTEVQQLSKDGKIEKIYLALVRGHWPKQQTKVTFPLLKHQLQSGERMVRVSAEGKPAVTYVQTLQQFADVTLLRIRLGTGRTHQIRVHTSHSGYPIVDDEKYGDKEFNKKMRAKGLHRLFLHAASLQFELPSSGKIIGICACLDKELLDFLKKLTLSSRM
jgi:23S rRNA pseudouridine955/2504/2580 synthase